MSRWDGSGGTSKDGQYRVKGRSPLAYLKTISRVFQLIGPNESDTGHIVKKAKLNTQAAQAVDEENIGINSKFINDFLTVDLLQHLRALCDAAPFQLYQKRGHAYKSAPKIEYFTLDAEGRRPVYSWGQHTELHHAGYEMPPILLNIKSIIESEFDLGVGYLNHCIIIVNENGEHGVPPHSDKHKDSQFFDISLGDCMTMVLRKAADYAVLFHCQLIGLYTCMPDAVRASKVLAGSVIQQCQVNSETDIGRQLVKSQPKK
eukprot:COSAG05_NODE_208_length_14084_cov_4.973671_4_plen_260_part_00